MARYKPVEYAQGQFISIAFEHQILPGSFEHALSFIVDNKVDFSKLDGVRRNDDGGAPAYDPRVMLKIVLCAYARGLLSSREIAAACEQNVVMMALSANTRPHFTTIARFISDMGDAAQTLFVDVLMYCDEMGLIGKEMFAVDGCKMSSNASKEQSGTRADFENRRDKFRARVDQLVRKHRMSDKTGEQELIGGMRAREEKAIETLKAKADKIDRWLRENPNDRKGSRGTPIKSSITDADSAKMVSGHGVVQGYNGIAMVDAKHQVIVGAGAFGKGHDAELLQPIVDQVRENFNALGDQDIYRKAKLTADTGFHTEESIKMLSERGVDGYVPDKHFRRRDPAFTTAPRHRSRKALIGRSVPPDLDQFHADDFVLDSTNTRLICPAGNHLYAKASNFINNKGFLVTQYMARKTDCRVCSLRLKCLRKPASSQPRSVTKFHGRQDANESLSHSRRMIAKIETAAGRFLYSMRMGIVEPVFANLCHMLGLDRLTLRGNIKVNVQWRLFTVVHNLLKIHRFAWTGSG